MKTPGIDSIAGSLSALPERRASCAAPMLLLLGAGATLGNAQAYEVTVDSMSLAPAGTVLSEGIASVALPEGGCGVATVTADPSFVGPDGVTTYYFAFWNIDATPYTTTEVSFETLCTSASTATAWFLPTGPGTGAPAVGTTAFSLNQNGVIANKTPIGSVTNGEWAGGNSTVVYTSGTLPVTITALPKIKGYGLFADWEKFAIPADPLVTGNSFTVKPNQSATAIAFFGIPVPDPCNIYREEWQSCLWDLPATACAPFGKQVQYCETKYGED